MDKVILIRYGELHLKGNNRSFFEKTLISDIKTKLKGIKCELKIGRGRYTVSNFADDDTLLIVSKLCKVFGLHSVSVALKCPANVEALTDASIHLFKDKSGSFKVQTNRADKSFLFTSIQLSALIGEKLLDANNRLSVDLHHPQSILSIDIREDGYAFVFCDRIMCAGGMPYNSAGRGILLLSGGLDSPVAGYMMAKRGLHLTALHFHSYPYTNEKAQQKVCDLAKRLATYTNQIELINVKLTEIQEEIHKNCANEYMITLLRVVMLRIAELIAAEKNCGCIVNGESLAQVASQTLESIQVTNSYCRLPIFRPLIGMDKQEIVDIAKKIETFDISILPFEDCCTVFLPDHPATKPSLRKVKTELEKITNLDRFIQAAVDDKKYSLIRN